MSCTRILRKRKISADNTEALTSASQEERPSEEQLLEEKPEDTPADTQEETPTKKAKPSSDDAPPSVAPVRAPTPEPPVVEQGKTVDDPTPNASESIVAAEQ